MVNVIQNLTKPELKRLESREGLLNAHNKKKVPKSMYSYDKKTGKPYLSPHKLRQEGY